MHSRYIVVLVAFLAVGVPFWIQPYFGLNLPDGLIHPGLLAIPAAAAWLRLRGRWRQAQSFGVASAIAPAVVLLRVIVETARDPTLHNLWPFEIFIASVLGCVMAAVGVVAARMIGSVRR
jgi:hypothetical protein